MPAHPSFSPAAALFGATLAKPIESSAESDGILEQALQFGGVQLNIGQGSITTEGQTAEQSTPGGRGDSKKAQGGIIAQTTPLIFGLAIIIGLIKVFGKKR